jgi:hypothetical protein
MTTSPLTQQQIEDMIATGAARAVAAYAAQQTQATSASTPPADEDKPPGTPPKPIDLAESDEDSDDDSGDSNSKKFKPGRVTFLLNKTNFKEWKKVMISTLMAKSMWKYVRPKDPRKATKQQHLNIILQLQAGLTEDGVTSLGNHNHNGHTAWETLCSSMEKENDNTHFERITELTALRLADDGDLDEHNTKFFALLDHIDSTDGDMNPEEWKRMFRCIMYLASLPPRFETFKRLWMTRIKKPGVTAKTLRSEAFSDTYMQSGSRAPTIQASQTANFAAQNSTQPQYDKKPKNKGYASDGTCLHVGHNKEDCYQLYPSKMPEWKRMQLAERKAKRDKSQVTSSANVAVSATTPMFTPAWIAIIANAAIQMRTPSQWVIDSGASRHITGDKSALTNLHSVPSNAIVSAGGHKIVATQAGDLHVCLSLQGNIVRFTLHEVLYSPDIGQSLISMRLLRDVGIKSLVDDHCELIKDGKSLGYVKHVNNVFPVTLLPNDTAAHSALPSSGQRF